MPYNAHRLIKVMRLFGIYIAVLLIVMGSLLERAQARDIKVIQDIPYRHVQGIPAQYSNLDIYYDPDRQEPKKLMLFIHGGSWISGDKKLVRKKNALPKWFIDKGYIVAVPNFRLASKINEKRQITYIDQARDIALAISWLIENKERYGVSDDKILLTGFSSGAHLSALISSDKRYLNNEGLSLNNISGVISLDVHAYDVPYALALMQNSDLKNNMAHIRYLFGEDKHMQEIGSPISYISGDYMPPRLIISAGSSSNTIDRGYIAKKTAKHYQSALNRVGHYANSFHFDHETHNSLVLDFGKKGDGPTRAVDKFLEYLDRQ